ncbi:site-specific DNA-methyltransferase [Bacillus megaterium]|uniref:DNA-methyltransferase n=1 Tax=Priestia megaterium TaxID=1404 RepID=UPI001292D485|nr:site-specific DNA-methyltransferase [Priestia megaterium]MQR87658.1 site-specific DNA-methyltransferase [Priestia megaterium]
MKLINGDAFSKIKRIPSNSVHLVCTDPPYFVSRRTNFQNGGGNQKKYGSVSMEFGDWDLEKNKFNWLSLLQEFKRVLVPGGTMVIFYDIFKMNDISLVAEKLNLKQPRIGVWEKSNPVPLNAKVNYLSNSREYFISYTKGRKRTFNSYYDKAFYEAPIVGGKIRFHPCQKPVTLLQKIIAAHTNEGDTVLDCFMGSGSTGQAAINLNRNFIGFEIDNVYFEKASIELNKTYNKQLKISK